MLAYSDHPTPPFNSPYQHHTSRTPLLQTPYPSPNRVESRSKYADGLGLYNYQQHCLPPSPQPSPTWANRSSNGASSLVNETIADPWASGAFDHPVARSPQPWSPAQTSPRSSLSYSVREMSIFSHAGSDSSYSGMTMENAGWAAGVCYDMKEPCPINSIQFSQQHAMALVPNRMSVGGFSYEDTYGASSMATHEPVPVLDYRNHECEQTAAERSVKSLRTKTRSKYTTTSVPRERSRNPRHTDPAHAPFRCDVCPNKGFARRYNFRQHMLTHEAHRKKDHVCPHGGCTKAFTRKTDLVRHNVSVHLRLKEFKCVKCPRNFSRKDTLRR